MSQEVAPILLKYKLQLEKNPRSAVFAPLAELYRKSGMIDEALRVLKNGIRHHPNYVAGYLAMAGCYYDLGQYPMAYATLRPLVENQRDNIRLQSLFAKTCMELVHLEEALDAFKYLLFLNPKDKQIAIKVRELEDRIEKPAAQPLRKEQIVFQTENIFSEKTDELDDWQQVNFSGGNGPREAAIEDTWKVAQEPVLPVIPEIKPVVEQKVAVPKPSEKIEEQAETSVLPMATHTLVDLYVKQGHYHKAIEILERLIELNPQDSRSLLRRKEVMKLKEAADSHLHDNGEDILLAALDQRRADEKEELTKRKINKLEALMHRIRVERSERLNR